MTKEQTNKFLTLLMDKEWNDWNIEDFWEKDNLNSDYFSDANFLEYMRWAWKQE